MTPRDFLSYMKQVFTAIIDGVKDRITKETSDTLRQLEGNNFTQPPNDKPFGWLDDSDPPVSC